MTPPDRTLGHVPALTSDRVARPLPPSPEPQGPTIGGPSSPRRRFSARLVWRGLRRHWWQAALLWAAGSAGLVALAHHRVKPTFEASSAIRIDPGDRGRSREGGPAADFEVFKETQVRRVTNPNVIASALAAHPDLVSLPRLARAQDPEAEIGRSLGVMLVPGTNLILVSMTGESSAEPAEVVNAVVDAYLEVALDAGEEEDAGRSRRLREVQQERTAAVARKRDAVALLAGRIGSVDAGQARDRNSATIETYKDLSQQFLQADIELVEAQAALDQPREEPRGPAPGDPPRGDGDAVAAFYAVPEVAEIQSRLARARDGLARTDRNARDVADRSRVASKKEADDLQTRLDVLWSRMGPGLARTARPNPGRETDRKAAELKVNGLKARIARLDERLGRLNVQTRVAGADELALEFARQDLSRAESVLDAVTRGLDRAEFEAGGPVARFRREYRARAPDFPDSNRRNRAMAAAPVAVLLAVLGLFTLVEFRAGRVVDPEDVPGRLRLTVLGVVPPLPKSRTPGRIPARDDLRSRRDLDRFIQSLDHLRVAICSGRDARGRPLRSIVITSACGGEGKTTLAAQLAERCVNSGMATLLIDADLRNPTLSRMFDRPTGRGLVNVLGGEAMPEEAITTVGGAGGFHFLAAGSPRVDPARLLQDDRLASLLVRARESFDIGIVDAPPVLPVPDALTIGRWVDGAVLAVRFDSSRYPLVERARGRLASVGVPVLGAVINGVRGAEAAYYGADYPSYGSPDGDEGSATIEV